MGQKKWLVKIERSKKSVRPNINVFVQKTSENNINFLKRMLADSTLSVHLNHHECNNFWENTKGRRLFMIIVLRSAVGMTHDLRSDL